MLPLGFRQYGIVAKMPSPGALFAKNETDRAEAPEILVAARGASRTARHCLTAGVRASGMLQEDTQRWVGNPMAYTFLD